MFVLVGLGGCVLVSLHFKLHRSINRVTVADGEFGEKRCFGLHSRHFYGSGGCSDMYSSSQHFFERASSANNEIRALPAELCKRDVEKCSSNI